MTDPTLLSLASFTQTSCLAAQPFLSQSTARGTNSECLTKTDRDLADQLSNDAAAASLPTSWWRAA
jgi:hypothetical protein